MRQSRQTLSEGIDQPARVRPLLAVAAGLIASCGLNADISGEHRLSSDAPRVGRQPSALVSADFDRDGRPDLAVASRIERSVSILLNRTPLGSSRVYFAPPLDIALGSAPVDLATGDLDSDGRPDLVVAHRDEGSLTLLSNDGNLSHFSKQTVRLSGRPAFVTAVPQAVGTPDELVVLLDAESRLLRLRRSAGRYQLHQTLGLDAPGSSVRGAELDGRAGLDVVVASYGANRLQIFCNEGAAGLKPCARLAAGLGPVSVHARDLDGDHKADLVSVNRDSRDLVLISAEWTEPSDTPRFAAPTVIQLGHSVAGLGVLDVDGDGRSDLVSIGGGRVAAALRSPASGRFLPASTLWSGLSSTPTALAVADFNTDGREDIAIALQSRGRLVVRLMPSEPSQSAAVPRGLS